MRRSVLRIPYCVLRAGVRVSSSIPNTLYPIRVKPQSGFTLIELLIASGLFAIVALLSYGAVAGTQRVASQTAAQAALGETALFALESVARDARLANGNLTLGLPAFEILTDAGTPALPNPIDGRVKGEQLRLRSTDRVAGSVRIRTIRVEEGAVAGQRQLVVVDCSDEICLAPTRPSYLTPSSVTVVEFAARALPSSQTDRQPFVELTLVIEAIDQPNPGTPPLRQTVTMLVSNRSLGN